MNFLKRASWNMRKRWVRFVLTTVIFSAVFSVIFGCVVIISSTGRSMEKAERISAGAVTLYGAGYITIDAGGGGWKSTPIEDAEVFADSEYVYSYNFALQGFPTVQSENTELYVRNPDLVKWDSIYSEIYRENIYGVTDSELSEAFSAYGYKLLSGDPIIPEDRRKNYLLISREYAEANDLSIGDAISFTAYSYSGTELQETYDARTFTVRGIFATPPQGRTYYTWLNEDPANFMFANTYDLLEWLPEYEHTVSWVTIFLKNADDIYDFLEEAGQKLNLRGTTLQFPGAEDDLQFDPPDVDVADLPFREHHFYGVQWTKDWYEMIAEPTEAVRSLAMILAAALLAGAVVVLILICILNVRGRQKEFGLLLAMGETKVRTAAQVILETLIPVLTALALGVLLSLAVTAPALESWTNEIMAVRAEERQAVNQELTREDADRFGTTTAIGALQARTHSGVQAQSSITFSAEPAPLLLCGAAVLLLALLILCLQIAAILRAKPAELLRRRQ